MVRGQSEVRACHLQACRTQAQPNARPRGSSKLASRVAGRAPNKKPAVIAAGIIQTVNSVALGAVVANGLNGAALLGFFAPGLFLG